MTKTETKDLYKVMFTNYPDVVNVVQLGEMLGNVSEKTVRRLLKEKIIPSFFIGKKYLIPKINVIEYLTSLEKSVS